jgi:hypothetical protein
MPTSAGSRSLRRLPKKRSAAAPPQAIAAPRRGNPKENGGVLQALSGRNAFGAPRPPGPASAPGRPVSSPRFHQAFAARYRETFWRPRSHPGATCLSAHRRDTQDGPRFPTRSGFPAHRPREQNLTNSPALLLPQPPRGSRSSANDRCRWVGKIQERRTKMGSETFHRCSDTAQVIPALAP